MNFFHREGPAAQGMARRPAIKKAPWKNAANQLGCVIFYGAWEYEEFSVLLKSE